MCDRVLVYDRCIAMQLQKESFQHQQQILSVAAVDKRDVANQQLQQHQQQQSRGLKFLPFQYGSLNRKQSDGIKRKDNENSSLKSPVNDSVMCCDNENNSNKSVTLNSICVSPIRGINSPLSSNSSGTPTPTNGVSPVILNSNLGLSPHSSDIRSFNSYQEGYRLYQIWVATNAECVWDQELVKAVTATHFVGFLVGGFVLIGGPPRVIAAITHAYSRALLNAPPGWIIIVLGELRECEVSVVQRGQFTPLGDALCWSIHRLVKNGFVADQKRIHESLLINFPAMAPPEPALIHAALTDLIRQRKVFYTGKGYRIVQACTYLPEITSPQSKDNPNLPPRLLTTSEALTKAHGAAETETIGDVTHAAVQTDLADLLAGIWPNSSILVARPPSSPILRLQRSGSFRGERHTLPPILCERDKRPWQSKYQTYEALDTSDVTIKGGDKGSVLSKILRVSQPRRRLASFSAQFPPPEWTEQTSKVKHMHSVATQTRSPRHPGGPETCMIPTTQWAPRSSTLPRKPSKHITSSPATDTDVRYRPHSTSPSPHKIFYNNTQIPHLQRQSGVQQMSSSPSPCITSTHSSRTTSPSLQSTTPTSHSDSRTYGHSSRSHSPYKVASPKHKLSSPKSKNRRNHTSSPQINSSHIPQQSPQRKPPPMSYPHHTFVKDHKKKVLSLVPNETLVLENSHDKHKRLDNNESRIPICNTSSSPDHAFKGKSISMERRQSDNTEGTETMVSRINVHQTEKRAEDNDVQKNRKQNRSSLQLDLASEVHMNNYKKIIATPQKPEGLKNNVFHENLSSIAKGSVSELTSKNLGYRDVNKCDKRLYSEETIQNGIPENEKEDHISEKDSASEELNHISDQNCKIGVENKRKLKLSLPLTENSILKEGSLKKLEKKLHRKGLISPDNHPNDKDKLIISPLDDIQSVKTYPSFSDLNLTFSSLAAQKILQGVSVNSIDTLVEVNMIAEKRKHPNNDGVTNTDFGFV